MRELFRRLWPFARPYRARLYLGLLSGFLYAAASGAMMVLVRIVVNLVFPGAEPFSLSVELEKLARAHEFFRTWIEALSRWLPDLKSPASLTGQVLLILTLPLVVLFRVAFSYLNVYLTNWAGVRAIADLRTRLFDHLQNLSLAFFSTARTGELITRVINDTHLLHSVVTNSLASLIKDPLTIICLVFFLLAQQSSRTLTLVSLLVLPVCVIPITLYTRRIRRSGRALQSYLADLSTLMHEAFTGNRIVKAYNLEPVVLQRFVQATRAFVSHAMRLVRANELPSQITEFLGVVGVSLILIYVVFAHPNATPGDFVSFILSILLVYQPIKSLIRLYGQLQQAASASRHVFELLETPSEISSPAHPIPLHASGADIHFQNIDFDYGARPVLRDVNLSVKAGQLVALVGRSGSGKTTLTNLLMRFYDPKHGAVRIGPADLRDVAIHDLRSQIALVAQETILFNDTIRRNIELGRPGASNAEIEAAARHAFAHDFIVAKPEGYDTIVGEKGATLSGGQRQRISIARAILRNAPILILDEATNSLDAESERAVQAALEELMQHRTTICIAHRLSTVQKADRIVVLDQGRILETGTHAELIKAAGPYSRLYELQFESGSTDREQPQNIGVSN